MKINLNKIDIKGKKRLYYGIVVIIVLLVLIIASSLGSFFKKSDKADDLILVKQNELLRYNEILSKENELKSKNKKLKEYVLTKERQILFTGNTPELILARIQTYLNKKADKAGVQIKRIRTLKPVLENGYTVLSLQVDLMSSLGAFLNLMEMINQYDKLLMITSAKIMVINQKKVDNLKINITIAGFIGTYAPKKGK